MEHWIGMYKLYSFQGSGNCYKIELLLKQLGLEYELVSVDILKGESRTEDFLKINPNGRVPVLQIGDKYLPESNAAIWYLAEESKLIPSGQRYGYPSTGTTRRLQGILARSECRRT